MINILLLAGLGAAALYAFGGGGGTSNGTTSTTSPACTVVESGTYRGKKYKIEM